MRDCLAELLDPTDRRHRHPFITCTNCGPRFTIITGLPYDRPTPPWPASRCAPPCAAEYADPADRRFHAQTICCHDCGPRLSLTGHTAEASHGEVALATARSLLRDGAVVAVKGIGGYHLACDATDQQAVQLLRKRKQRGDKPFAVMTRDLEDAHRLLALDEAEAALLGHRSRPVLLASRARSGTSSPRAWLRDRTTSA